MISRVMKGARIREVSGGREEKKKILSHILFIPTDFLDMRRMNGEDEPLARFN